MRKYWIIGIGLVALLALGSALPFCTAGLAAETSATPANTCNISAQTEGIWVTGQGQVTVTPDIVAISLGVSAQAKTVADALSSANTAMSKVLDALAKNGIAQNDIKTQYFNISQTTRYDNNTQTSVVTGYQVSNTVNVKVRNINNAGPVIDAVAAAGGDLTRVNSVSFSVDDPAGYYDNARKLAIADAQRKASQLADLSGVTLGRATYINEGSTAVPTPTPVLAAPVPGAAAGTSISPGEMKITLNVQMAFAIQ